MRFIPTSTQEEISPSNEDELIPLDLGHDPPGANVLGFMPLHIAQHAPANAPQIAQYPNINYEADKKPLSTTAVCFWWYLLVIDLLLTLASGPFLMSYELAKTSNFFLVAMTVIDSIFNLMFLVFCLVSPCISGPKVLQTIRTLCNMAPWIHLALTGANFLGDWVPVVFSLGLLTMHTGILICFRKVADSRHFSLPRLCCVNPDLDNDVELAEV
jgi:hypothetical protein